MTRTSIIPFAAVLILLATAIPAGAGGYVGLEISNHGVSMGFGASNWGIWGSSWHSGGASIGFSATLSGYGDWIHVDGLGRVWRPWVATGWQPYTHGRWTWTSLGWTWVAYEPWGWIPHHYGNWAFSTVGWVWAPGYAYHPGNVVWVSTGVHLGWYPCAPRGWSHAHRGYHRGRYDGYGSGHRKGYTRGYADGWRDARYATWVPRSHVTAENIAHHAVGHEAATHAVARSRVATVTGAPTRTQVENFVGRTVPEARIVERKTTVDGREVRMVRPEGQQRIVQRHGAPTVERALSPEARRTVSSGAATLDRQPANPVARTTRKARPASAEVETRSSTDNRGRYSPPRTVDRSTRPDLTGATPSHRTTSSSGPGPQRHAGSVSAVQRGSTDNRRPATATTRESRRVRSSTSPTSPVAKAAPQHSTAPSAQRQRNAGGVAKAKTAGPELRQRERKEKTEPTEAKTAKRRRSRN